MVKLEKEKEIHRNTPLRYQKYHTNGNLITNFCLYITISLCFIFLKKFV